MVATASPNVSAICTMDGGVSFHVKQDPQPISTNRRVPMNSANSIRHMCLLSVISDIPKKLLLPTKLLPTKINWK